MKKFLLFLVPAMLSFNAESQSTLSRLGLYAGSGHYNSFVGYLAGEGSTSSTYGYNTFIGALAGRYSDGQYNVSIGYNTGVNNDGNRNVFVGTYSGYSSGSGWGNTMLGYYSGRDLNSGYGNTMVGEYSGNNNTIGSNNTFLGRRSGYNSISGNLNVFVGYEAGFNETGSNKLYIDNSSTSAPLIWGDFSTNELTINGTLQVTGGIAGVSTPNTVITNNNQWNPDSSPATVFAYDDNNPTYNSKYVGAIINIRGDGVIDNALIRSGAFHANHFQASNGFYVGNPEVNGTKVIDSNGDISTSNLDLSGIMTVGSPTLPASPTGAMYVKGYAYFTDINVQADGTWPDYVFANDYELRTLEETEEYILENQHLPDVPSATVIGNEGIDLAEMNRILLQKVEELTLHLIDQNKKLKSLEDKIYELTSN